jgi:hypothetical protein
VSKYHSIGKDVQAYQYIPENLRVPLSPDWFKQEIEKGNIWFVPFQDSMVRVLSPSGIVDVKPLEYIVLIEGDLYVIKKAIFEVLFSRAD